MRGTDIGRTDITADPPARRNSPLPFGHRSPEFAVLLGCLCLWPFAPTTAQGQTAGNPPPPPHSDGETIAVGDDREIVVTARYGEALVEPETELDEQQIDAYGAYSIGELIRRITPLTGRPDERPIILINGERVDSIQDLARFPPAALQRLAILPPEAAGRYGYSGNQRVVNLVLKKHFVSWETQAGVKLPSAGGRVGGNGSAGRFVIDGKARWSAQVQLSGESALLKSSRAPSLLQAGASVDPDDYLSLLPATNQLSVSMGHTRPIGRFTGSFSVNAGTSDSRQWLGLAPADPGSADTPILLGRQSSQNLGLSATFSGRLAGGRAIFSANYARGWANGRIDQADNVPPDGFRTSRNRSVSESLSTRLTFNRSIINLPAGPLTATLTAGMSRSRTTSRFDGSVIDGDRIGRAEQERFDGRLSFAMPIARRSENPYSLLGDLSLDLAGGVTFDARAASRPRFELGASWSPVPALRINGSLSFAKLAPSIEQLTAPYLEEVRRVYDFARQEIAEPIWVTGGNPDLESGQRRTWSLGATLRPFDPRLLSLSVEYQKQQSMGGAGGFPGLTLAVEAAIPDRFVRDASGRLIRVDARPIRLVRDATERLNNSLTLSPLLRAKNKDGTASAIAAASMWNISFTLNHGWSLRSELVTAIGLPPIDRLRGGAAQSRHSVGFQLVAGRPGMGATLDGNWQSAFRLYSSAVDGGAHDYRYKAAMTLNLRLFAEPERLLRVAEKPVWLSNLNISLDIQNLFDSYRRVTLADGTAAPGYKRYEADPLGRTIQLSLRKRF
ncbi:hypothetical protein SKP52_08115 [Sphingopyxis fribergensis]|uniref:TonB-dependent receptor n=1 Tax=Sphingopyxis fribergensis TaxID=1515612 RepID=A0A0A7PKS0_9SPHN|nr:hypothetical protein [Sphingopyxis fribergensis]AJA08542.1 hypothetical protein SKP52_08115 [Sphingopyxis fribergensis]